MSGMDFLLTFLPIILSRMPYMKRKKFDIQFTFNRLPVQMEHRACDRITRTEMRHVLFPREDVLHQRGEMNQQVRSVHARKSVPPPPPFVLHTHTRVQIARPLNRPLWGIGWEGADAVSNCTMGFFWGTISSMIGCRRICGANWVKICFPKQSHMQFNTTSSQSSQAKISDMYVKYKKI